MENAVIYARYSSHNQTENSIEAQVSAAMQYANAHKYNVIEIFADRAKTGANDNREEFQRMLSATEGHGFTVIIVWKVDRFGRNREEIALNKYRCKKNGVRVEYVAENITSGPEGVILESVLEGFAEYYSRQLSQNTKRGIKNVASKGGYTGGKPPYGYRIVDGKYKVVPEEAKKIKEVFKLFAAGLNFTEIAEKLDLQHYNIRIYLSNKSYYDGVYRRCGACVENIIPPIIDEHTFMSVQDKLNDYTRKKKPEKYLLTGKIFCKECGAKYIGSSSCGGRWSKMNNITYSYYQSTCKCQGHLTRIRKDLLDESCLDQISTILQSEYNLDNLVSKIHQKLEDKLRGSSSLDTKKSLSVKRQRLIDAYEKGVLEMNELSERLAVLDEALAKCSLPVYVPSETEIKNFILEMKNINSDRALISSMVSSVIVNPKNKKYKIRFGLSNFSTD